MRFETTMSQFGNNTGIEVPAEVIEELGGGRRPALVVTVDGFTYRSTVGVMAGKHLIPFSADKRRESGIGGGDAITVDVELDTAPRTVETPEDLAQELASAGLRPAFDALSPSAQKAHVTAVTGAKAPETRQRRIERVVASLS
jgi:hypothetical protein